MINCFLSYRYNPKGEELAHRIRDLMKSYGVVCRDGKEVQAGNSLNDQIKSVIDDCDFLVVLFTDGTSGDYVSQEVGYAQGQKKRVLVISEDQQLGGLVSADFQISLSRGEIQACAQIFSAVENIKTQVGVSTEPLPLRHSPVDVLHSEGWAPNVLEKLLEIRGLFNQLEYGKVLDLATRLFKETPLCWRAGIAISASFIAMEKHKEALEAVEVVMGNFDGNGRVLSHAYQNKGGVLDELREAKVEHRQNPKELLEQSIECYRKANRYEPRVAVYVNLISDLLRLDRVDEAEAEMRDCLNRLPDAKEEFIKEIEKEGASMIREISKSQWLSAILFPKKGG